MIAQSSLGQPGGVCDAVRIEASSQELRRFREQHVLRHAHGRPRGRARTALIMRAVLEQYPDAVRDHYAGGVLRFRWNDGEGRGEAWNTSVTPGPVNWR